MAVTVTHDHVASVEAPRPAVSIQPPHVSWTAIAPVALALGLALSPPPDGLAPHAWYFFAIFAVVILGLMLEPLPGGAIGLIGVTVVTVLSPFVLFAPAELAKRKKLLDLKADLMVVEKQMESSRHEEAQLKKTIASLQGKVDVLPSRESELVELTRDYGTLQAAYSSLLIKREDSLMAANLERRQIGEQFRILDPASMPEKPYNQMQRLGVTFSGALAGLGLGLFLVAFRELRDSSFRSEDEVMAALSLPVLALIPVMNSPRERNASVWRQRWMDAAGVSVLLAAVAVVVIWRFRS